MTRRTMDWLSLASEDTVRCRQGWADEPRKPQVLTTGTYFDVLATDQRVGMETFDQLRRRGMPVGAVMVDWAARRMGFFLPPASGPHFARALGRETDDPPAYRVLSEKSYVVVPGPMALSGDRFEWLNAPIRPQDCSRQQTVALAVTFAAASQLIARADRYGQETAHAR